MPKPKRIKNALKSFDANTSPTTPSSDTCSHPHLAHTSPNQSPTTPSSVPLLHPQLSPIGPSQIPMYPPQSWSPRPISPLSQSSSQASSTQAPSSQATSSQVPSIPAPSMQAASMQAPSRHKGIRESNHYWLVDVIDEQGVTKPHKLKVKDVFNLPPQMRVVVNFDEYLSPIGEAAGLLAGICGQMAIDTVAFPISFSSWSLIPSSFIDHCFLQAFKSRFCFGVDDHMATRYINHSIGKKWREFRCKLWNEFYDPTKSKLELMNNVPGGIPADQWAIFVDYRLKPETQEICKRNQENRKKQTVPHTSGAKSLARRRDELKAELGRNVSRDLIWEVTHKRKDGSYINEKAREIGEKIQEYRSQSTSTSSEISPHDAVGVILGPEHPGRVRGLGMGVVPSMAFKETTGRIGGINLGCACTNATKNDDRLSQMEDQISALWAYIRHKEGGNIPEDLAAIFPQPREAPADHGSGVAQTNNARKSSGGSSHLPNQTSPQQ